MSDKKTREDIVSRLTSCQSTIFAYILALVHDVDATHDILQDINLVIWRKLEEGTEVQNFVAWAREVARLKVLAYLRDKGRDRHIFDATFVERISDTACDLHSDSSAWMSYLEDCLQLRTEQERQLLNERYQPGASVKELAKRRHTTAGKISTLLSRARRKIAECVGQKIAAEATQ